MAIFEIPTRSDLPAYNFRISLNGTTYTIYLDFNERMGKWIFGIGDAQGNRIVSAVPVIVNWPLFERFKTRGGLPTGIIGASDSSGSGLDPGRYDLGSRVRLYYKEAT